MEFEEQVCALAKALNCHFTVKGDPITIEQAMSKTAFLPAIMRRADQLASFCLGYGLGLTFDKAESATLGVKVEFDDKTPSTLRLLCCADVIIELMQAAPSHEQTPLDDLLLD